MRYIVTGGAGFIGSNLADTLAIEDPSGQRGYASTV
jgi:nucleoside-diphosphate-sugar epimerase